MAVTVPVTFQEEPAGRTAFASTASDDANVRGGPPQGGPPRCFRLARTWKARLVEERDPDDLDRDVAEAEELPNRELMSLVDLGEGGLVVSGEDEEIFTPETENPTNT